jgi:serine/threonine protein kinase
MQVPAEKWEEVKGLFEAVLEQPLEARASFLAASQCEPEVRQQVERLLECHEQEQADGFLKTGDGRPRWNEDHGSIEIFQAGDTLAGRFQIIRFIARGGMGEVYEAEDLELGGRVAIKTIRREALQHPKALDKFKREVNLAKRVTHPNICRVFDLFRHRDASPDAGKEEQGKDVLLVTMELLHGETLAQRLKQRGRMTVDEARPIALQMAKALGAAHAAGVLHRDFKPGNVLLVSSNSQDTVRAVVSDFGIAVGSDGETESGGSQTGRYYLTGTPAYMSPEQLEGGPLTPACDIYSLGLVMFEMVTGRPAFGGQMPVPGVTNSSDAMPQRPSELVTGFEPT